VIIQPINLYNLHYMIYTFKKILTAYIAGYVIPYWANSGIYYLLDTSGNKYIQSLKLQKDKCIDLNKYKKTIFHVLKHQILTIPFLLIFVPLVKRFKNDMTNKFPTVREFIRRLLMIIFIFEVLFYTGHYIIHSKCLYGRIHKKHHEWTAPVAAAAHYNHFLEHIILNITVPSISAIITGSNFITILFWFMLASISVTSTHSGYWFALARKHDNHHKYFNCEYGVIFMDYLFNTALIN